MDKAFDAYGLYSPDTETRALFWMIAKSSMGVCRAERHYLGTKAAAPYNLHDSEHDGI